MDTLVRGGVARRQCDTCDIFGVYGEGGGPLAAGEGGGHDNAIYLTRLATKLSLCCVWRCFSRQPQVNVATAGHPDLIGKVMTCVDAWVQYILPSRPAFV